MVFHMLRDQLMHFLKRFFNYKQDRDFKIVLNLINSISSFDIKSLKEKDIRNTIIRSNFDTLGHWHNSINAMIKELENGNDIKERFYDNIESRNIYLDDWLTNALEDRFTPKEATMLMKNQLVRLIEHIESYQEDNLEYFRYYKRLNAPHFQIIKQWNEILKQGV